MSYPQSIKDQFLTLRTEGHSYTQIAKVLKVSRHTLILWGKVYRVQIDADRAADQEDLVSRLHLQRTQRLTILAALYHRVCKAIEQADLTARGIGTLVTLLLKLNTAIEAYDIDPAACDLTVQKTEPPDSSPENTPLQPPETPELTPMVQKTEPKLNQDTLSSRTEHFSSSTNLAKDIEILENDIQCLFQHPETPEVQHLIREKQELLAQYQSRLVNRTP